MAQKRHYDQSADKDEYLVEAAGDFNNASTSDLVVVCNGVSIRCHKLILCRRSEWFKTAVESKFKEKNASEIELKDEVDSQAIQATLEFCYTFDYTAPEKHTSIFHVRMFAAAEKYFVRNLKQLATDRFIEAAQKDSDDDLAQAIAEAYAMTTDSDKILRHAILEISLVRAKDSATWDQQPLGSLEKLLDTVPAYAADMARGSMKNATPPERQYQCPSGCGFPFSAIIIDTQNYTHACTRHGRSVPYTYSGANWNTKYVIR